MLAGRNAHRADIHQLSNPYKSIKLLRDMWDLGWRMERRKCQFSLSWPPLPTLDNLYHKYEQKPIDPATLARQGGPDGKWTHKPGQRRPMPSRHNASRRPPEAVSNPQPRPLTPQRIPEALRPVSVRIDYSRIEKFNRKYRTAA